MILCTTQAEFTSRPYQMWQAGMPSKSLGGITTARVNCFGFAKISGELTGECQDTSTFMLARLALTVLHSLARLMFE